MNASKDADYDEYYTQLEDIEHEVLHYKEDFKGKTVLCNCDDPRVSNFFKYFSLNFEFLGLKRLIATCYKNQNADLFSQHDCEKAVYIIYDGDKNGNYLPDPSEMEVKELQGDGSYSSAECVELLKQADIVCTNPPFSLFLDYVDLLFKYNKKFLILGNMAQLNSSGIFSLVRQNKIWSGYQPFTGSRWFEIPMDHTAKHEKIINGKKMVPIKAIWFTNLDVSKHHEPYIFCRSYKEGDYPKYENYDAIDVGNLAEIPDNYYGIMGVPVTFLENYNPDEFEIIGSNCSTELLKELGVDKLGQDWVNRYRACGGTGHNTANMVRLVYNEPNGTPKVAFSRILIRRIRKNL